MRRLFVPFHVKAIGERPDGAVTLEGYGSVFDTIDSYGDTIVRGAFVETLKAWKSKGKLPKMLLQHGGGFFGGADDLVPIGKWTEMSEDEYGLKAAGYLFKVDTDRQKATTVAVKEGELDGLSIGFLIPKSGSSLDPDTDKRTITQIDLWELSLVTFPANDPARITDVRGLPTEREFEDRLERDAGLSKEQARRVVATCYRCLLRDVADETDSDVVGRHEIGVSDRALIDELRSVMRGDLSHGT
jgi:HK97 family phage prohead protease